MAVNKLSADDMNNDPAKVGTHYSVRNQHPGFNNDPNIMNEYGHTHYPKWVDHPSEVEGKTKDGKPIPKRVIVKDEADEKALVGEKALAVGSKKAAWNKE